MAEEDVPTHELEKEPEISIRVRYLHQGAIGHEYGLRKGDFLVAVNGEKFTGTKQTLKGQFARSKAPQLALTFLRGDKEFTILAGTYELCRWQEDFAPEIDHSQRDRIDPSMLENWEILRDRQGYYEVFPLHNPTLALVAAPIWLMNMRLWTLLASAIAVTGFSYAINPWAALAVYLSFSIWVWRNGIALFRMERRTRGLNPWIVVAANNETQAHEICRMLDPSLVYVFGETGIGIEPPNPVEL